ncbi:MAG: septum formation initiator family protein [Clostridia bacterium]|nr:septum formation initiator family protein [Clostridia bacterium]
MANRVYGYQGYKGYQFETSPKKLQPEYEPNKEQHTNKNAGNKTVTKKTTKTIKANEAKKNKASKAEIKKKAKFIAYIVFGFSVLFTISYRNSIINEKFNQKEALKAELTEIQKINEQLEVSVENELNLTSIEKMAKERLGMSKLGNGQKVYVNLPKKEYVESKTETIITESNESFYQKVYNKIKEFF